MLIPNSRKVYYFATKLKVIPQHWNKKKQLAEVSNFLSALDNQNNSILNARIEQYKERVKEYIDYLCKNPNEEVTPKKFIYKDMKGENILASTLIEQSYLILLKTSNWSAGTERDNRVKKDAIIKYLEAKGNSIDLLSQKGLNDYQEYLEEESNTGNKYINQKCRFFAKLVNDVLHINNKFLDYNIPTVSYRPLITVREKEESSNFPLSNEELDKLRNCKGLTKKEQYYRDIFLLQCACGLRVSDLKSFLEGDYKLEDGIYNYTAQKNKKSGGFKLLEEEDTLLLQKLQKEGKGIKKNYNKYLKSAAKKAGLDALHTYTNDKGEKTKYPKYDMITSHCARHREFYKHKIINRLNYLSMKVGNDMETSKLLYFTLFCHFKEPLYLLQR